jgi:hypothetical protein
MTTRRTTSNKHDPGRAKPEKAEAKRARRAEKIATAREFSAGDEDSVTDAQLLGRLKDLHDAFDHARVTFEEFDAEKSLLVDRIAKRVSGLER